MRIETKILCPLCKKEYLLLLIFSIKSLDLPCLECDYCGFFHTSINTDPAFLERVAIRKIIDKLKGLGSFTLDLEKADPSLLKKAILQATVEEL